MRSIFLILIPLLVSCSSNVPKRKFASINIPYVQGKIDYKKSSVQVFSDLKGQEHPLHYLFVQLRDETGKFVDCEKDDFFIRTQDGSKVDFNLLRKLPGRYYLIIEKMNGEDFNLDLLIKGLPLKEEVKIHLRKPHISQTKINLIEISSGSMILRLRLADKANRPVESPEIPEISLEGHGFIKELKYVGSGTWDFTVIYPEENQLMYFSVRSMGVYFPNLYRYQYVDK